MQNSAFKTFAISLDCAPRLIDHGNVAGVYHGLICDQLRLCAEAGGGVSKPKRYRQAYKRRT